MFRVQPLGCSYALVRRNVRLAEDETGRERVDLGSPALTATSWHSPPHLDFEGECQYLISAACYEHVAVIGKNPERMTECEEEVLRTCSELGCETYAWCVLPNHYHVLLKTGQIKNLRAKLGQFHGRSSFAWNGEDEQRGRKVWHNCFERPMKSIAISGQP